MKNAIITSLVLVCCLGVLAACGGAPTRQTIERDEDTFCRAVARARVLEAEYGINPPDGGEAGAKP